MSKVASGHRGQCKIIEKAIAPAALQGVAVDVAIVGMGRRQIRITPSPIRWTLSRDLLRVSPTLVRLCATRVSNSLNSELQLMNDEH